MRKAPNPECLARARFNVVVGGSGEQVVARSISGTFGGRLGFDGERLTMSDVRIDTAEGRLALNGWIDVIAETIRVEAQGRLDTDLARAGRLIGNLGGSLSGSAAADVTVSGPVADPTVHVVASARDLQYSSGRPEAASPTRRSLPSRSLRRAYKRKRHTPQVVWRFNVSMSRQISATAGATGTLQLTSTGASAGANQLHAHVEGVDIDRVLDVAGFSDP